MAFFIPVPASSFTFPHRSQVIANFYAHTNPESHPFPQPIELRSSVSEQEWQTRTVAIWNHFARYTWSKLLRAYLILALVFSLIGPITTNLIVHRIIYSGVEPLSLNPSDDEIRERLSLIRRGHLINFIAIILIFLIIWVPYLSYKSLGRRRLAALLSSFNQADAAKGNMQALNWICNRTSTFQSSGTIAIELPVAFVSAHQPTLFHQAAYLPEYLHKPTSSQAPPMYGYEAAQNGQVYDGTTKPEQRDVGRKA
ncbi:hypothetical protein PGT21_006861 [Puccinia graminis f. sp. tritici]|uniref:Uncharacterized protein n=1 Tax=Puccinia graminis f. sp. tritici TaxID=56615 RepID=A0A5B0S6T8_PUCGR|nr:hypothetical protein PGT21_006861 [Puccinia graminis f. sp. tritici]KAA1133552.1 hypothetical protein PGTUg99_023527 [Puccinia graminis f. sp. tritici]